MNNQQEEIKTEDTHISRILEGDEFGKHFDRSPDKYGKGSNPGIFSMFNANEWRFIIWSGSVFIFCIFAFSAVGSLFTLFAPDDSSVENTPIDNVISTTSTDSNTQAVPSYQEVSKQTQPTNTTYIAPSNSAIELPNRIEIPKVGINIAVLNPTVTDYESLDRELTKGAVRYPGSGYPGKGNMLLFGHSTGFKVVRNQAYKAFNNIKTLEAGDPVFIYTANKTYEYKVTTVKKVNKYDTKISFEGVGNMITLSTCDSFGTKSDRYVVEAVLVN